MAGMKWRNIKTRWRGFMSRITRRNTRQKNLKQADVPAGVVGDVHELIERARANDYY